MSVSGLGPIWVRKGVSVWEGFFAGEGHAQAVGIPLDGNEIQREKEKECFFFGGSFVEKSVNSRLESRDVSGESGRKGVFFTEKRS
jgi:hypothetical protein